MSDINCNFVRVMNLAPPLPTYGIPQRECKMKIVDGDKLMTLPNLENLNRGGRKYNVSVA